MCCRFALSLLAVVATLSVRQPNILLIVSDDQGYMGSPDIQTLCLDQLATEGARITCYYSASSACAPSRSALLTGRYPQRNGTFDLFRNDGAGAEGDSGPQRGGKATWFEGGVRVPFIIRWPGLIEPGTVNDEFLTALGGFPMLVRAACVTASESVELDGFDMLPALQGKQRSTREAMFRERQGEYGARVGKWKLVDSRREGRLFDPSKDLGESVDLSYRQPEARKRIEKSYQGWKAAMANAEPRGPFRYY